MKLRSAFLYLWCLLSLGSAAVLSNELDRPRLTVLSFNVYGLPNLEPVLNLSPYRDERIGEICSAFKQMSKQEDSPDVILLQELWLKKDQKALAQCGYRYYSNANHKDLDTGLLILSRYPIVAEAMIRYRATGSSRYFGDGERLVSKGAQAALIRVPAIGKVWITNTHLISFYSDHSYAEERLSQMQEYLNFLSLFVGDSPTVVGGDLNASPWGRANDVTWTRFKEAMDQVKFSESSYSKVDCTWCMQNTLGSKDGEGNIDHLFASSHFTPVETRIVFKEAVRLKDGTYQNLSDHFGFESVFEFAGRNPGWFSNVRIY